MNPRFKKLVALAVLLPFLGAYMIAAAALGERLPNVQWLKVPYYMAAGILWALPVRYLIIWANAAPEIDPKRDSSDAP